MHSWQVSGLREALGQRGDEALIAAIQAFKCPGPLLADCWPIAGRLLADCWPHHRINQRVTFDVPGTAAAADNVNQAVWPSKLLRA